MALGDILIRIKADNSEYVKKMKEAKEETDKALHGFEKGLIGVGSSIAGFSMVAATAMTGAVGTASYVASSYEDAFVGVKKVLDGTDAEFAELSKGIRNMAKEIPMSVEEIASLAEAAGRLGIPREQILDFTRTVADLGVTTNMGSEEASEAIARFANIMNMSLDDVGKFGSTLVHLGNNLATSEKDIMNMALRMAGIGRESKMAESDVLAFAGAISATGIRAEAGGSSFTRVMKSIIGAVHNGGEELENFGKLAGMSGADFKKAFEQDSAQATLALIKGLSKLSEEGANTTAILDELGISGVYNQDLMIRLAGASDVLEDSLSMGSQAWEDNTALVDEANQRYETFSSYVTIVKNRLKDFLITAGTPMLKVWKRWIEALEPVMQKIEGLAEKFEGLDEKTQDIIAVTAMLSPVFFGAIAAVAAIAAGIGKLSIYAKESAKALGLTPKHLSKFLSFGKSLARFGGILGIIISVFIELIPVIKKVYEGFKPLQDAVKSFTDTFKNAFGGIFNAIKDEVVRGYELLSTVMDDIREIIMKPFSGGDGNSVKALGTIFTGVVRTVENAIKMLKVIFDVVFPAIRAVVRNTFEGIIMSIKAAVTVVVGIVNTLILLFTGDFSGALDAFLGIFKDVWGLISDYLLSALNNIVESVSDIMGVIGNLFSSGWTLVQELFAKGLSKIWKGTDEGLQSVLDTFQSFFDGVTTVFTFLWDLLTTIVTGGIGIIKDLISGDFSSAAETMIKAWEAVKSAVSSVWEGIIVLFEGVLEILTGLLISAWDILYNTTIFVFEMVTDFLVSVWDGIVTLFTTSLEAIEFVVTRVWDGIKIATSAVWEAIKFVITGVWEGIKIATKATLDFILDFVKSVWDGIKIFTSTIWNGIRTTINLVWEGIKSIFTRLLPSIFSFIKDSFTKVANTVSDKTREAKEFIQKGWDDAVAFLKGIDLLGIGKDVISGFVNGIKSKVKDVADAAKSAADAVTGKIKSILKIASPSKVLRKFGNWTGEGFVIGMEGMTGKIAKAAENMAEAAVPDTPQIDLSYKTPAGIRSTLSSAVNGTVDIRDADSGIISELRSMKDEIANMKVVMSDREVGRVVTPHVNDKNAVDELGRFF